MGNPEEAGNIKRINKELNASRFLLEVSDDVNLFENSTNQNFNNHMNRM